MAEVLESVQRVGERHVEMAREVRAKLG